MQANKISLVGHPGYSRMFAPNKLTIGIFLPLRFYTGQMEVLKYQAEAVQIIDELNFAAVWVRDVPLYDPSFQDAVQLFDPHGKRNASAFMITRNKKSAHHLKHAI